MSITFNPNAEVQNVNFLKWIILIKIFMITWIYSQKIEPIIPIFWARDEEGEGESWILVDGGKNHNKVSTQTQYPISKPRPRLSQDSESRVRFKKSACPPFFLYQFVLIRQLPYQWHFATLSLTQSLRWLWRAVASSGMLKILYADTQIFIIVIFVMMTNYYSDWEHYLTLYSSMICNICRYQRAAKQWEGGRHGKGPKTDYQ